MNTESVPHQRDLAGTPWKAALLWGVPAALIIVGDQTGEAAHTALWTIAFCWAGVACLANALRCGRRHCFYTGPLFLLAALASLLYGLGALPIGSNGWTWIVGAVVAGFLVMRYGLEGAFGKYVASGPEREDSAGAD